jgi:hypothetical protein
MSESITRDDGTVELAEDKYDSMKAALAEAEDKADEADDLRAALSEAEDERDEAQANVEAMSPLVDELRAALADRTGLSEDFVSGMSPTEISEAHEDDLSDLLSPDAEASDEDGMGGGEPETETVGSSGEGVSQTGATGGGSTLTEDEQEQVAALEAKAEKAESLNGDGWDAAAERAREQIAEIKGEA